MGTAVNDEGWMIKLNRRTQDQEGVVRVPIEFGVT